MDDTEVLAEAARRGYVQGTPARGEYGWYRDGVLISPRWNDWRGALNWMRQLLEE